jgi:hypothetical protein
VAATQLAMIEFLIVTSLIDLRFVDQRGRAAMKNPWIAMCFVAAAAAWTAPRTIVRADFSLSC